MHKQRITITFTLALFISLFWVALHPTAVAAATFTVNSALDIVDARAGNGRCATATNECTLRAAIMEANALAGADTIRLPAGNYQFTVDGEENLAAAGDFDIRNGNLTIIGIEGAAVTVINAAGRDRVFEVIGARTLTLQGVTVTEGSAEQGGGIFLHPGAILNVGGVATAALPATILTGNNSNGDGAAIYSNRGTVMIRSGSSVHFNLALGSGGAVYSLNGKVTVTNGTLSNNDAGDNGGAIASIGSLATVNVTAGSVLAHNASGISGGAIYNEGGIVTVQSASTLTGNSAEGVITGAEGEIAGGGAIANLAGSATVNNSTLEANAGANGGGIFNLGTLLVKNNTRIEGSTGSGEGGGIYNGAGARTTLQSGTQGVVTVATNTSGAGAGGIENLGTLDIQASNVIAGNIGGDAGGGISNYGTLTMAEGVVLDGNTSSDAGGGLINHHLATLTGTATDPILILNNISGDAAGGVSNSTEGTLNVAFTTFEANSGADSGGGLVNRGVATVTDSSFHGNTSSDAAGGVANQSTVDEAGAIQLATISLSSVQFIDNAGADTGGAMVNTGHATVTDCTFTGVSEDSGGAVANLGIVDPSTNEFVPATLIMANSLFTYNSGMDAAGGLLNVGHATLTDTDFTHNSSGDDGGAINNEGVMTITGGNFAFNSAGGNGGAIANDMEGELTLNTVTIADNTALSGGGIAHSGLHLRLLDSTVERNSANSDGGGILAATGTMDITRVANGFIRYNTATVESGGGLYITGGATVNISNGRVFSNTAEANGGGIVVSDSSTLNIKSGTAINFNEATGSGGGGIYLDDATVNLHSVMQLRFNRAGAPGGGILDVGNSTLNMNGATVGTGSTRDIRNNTPDNIYYEGGVTPAGVGEESASDEAIMDEKFIDDTITEETLDEEYSPPVDEDEQNDVIFLPIIQQ